jgi:hypothetical protein
LNSYLVTDGSPGQRQSFDCGVTATVSARDFKKNLILAGGQCHPPKVVKKVVFLNPDRLLRDGIGKKG